MNTIQDRFWLTFLIVVTSLVTLRAQTVSLYYGDPSGNPADAFNGNVFRSGNQYGNATIYAVLGSGASSFQIVSPGENLTKTITSTGSFTIRPVSDMIVDSSKILKFSGKVIGSVAITVKPLSITTVSANVSTDVAPGSELTVSYLTGAGTFPNELASGKFKVQLLDASGNLLSDLLNSTDQYTGRELAASSAGGTRSIKATLPASTAPGSYRVRVITQGLTNNVAGGASSLFTVRANAPTIATGGVGTGAYCAGTTVSFPFSTTGTFPSGNVFRVQLTDSLGNNSQELTGSGTASPIRAVLPTSLPRGSYQFRIISSTTSAVSNFSRINVLALPSVTVSGSSAIIAGSQATVRLTFTGTPPWTVEYVDYRSDYAPTYTRTLTSSTSSATISPTLFSTTQYDKAFIKSFRDGGCGESASVNGSAQVSVTPLILTTGALSGTYCPGSTISVPFTTNSALPADAIGQVQLSDSTGNFQNSQIIGTGGRTSPISATLPATLEGSSGYRVRIVLQKPTTSSSPDYSAITNSTPSSLLISRPESPRTTDISFCSGTTTSPLSATGINLRWYAEGATQPLASAPVPPNDRNSRFFVSQTINGCESKRAIIQVTLKAVPPAPAVTNVSLCQGGQGQFSTSIPGALWYTSATGGVGSAQPPALNSQTSGDQTVYVTQTVNGCESLRSAVKATVYPIPAAPTVQTPPPLCQYATASPLMASGQNLTWYDQGNKLAGAPTSPTSVSGTKSYSVSQSINGCESSRILVEQLIRPAPAVPTVTSVRYCVGDVPRSLTAVGTNVRWYTAQAGGTGSASSPAFFTEQATVLTFYATQTDNNNCESLRQPVSVSVVAAPSPPIVTPNQTVCQFAKVGPLSASPIAGLVWQGSGINGTSEVAPTPNTAQAATFTYQVTQKVGTCTSPASTITFTIRKLPDAPRVVSPVAFCIGQTNSTLSAVAEGRLTWYVNADRSGPAAAQITARTDRSSVITYYVTQTDGSGCESLNSQLEVRVAAKATARLTGDGDIYAGDSSAVRVRLTGDGPWKFTDWNGTPITTSDSLYVKWEKPLATRTFAISNLSSACGIGDIVNNYTLVVRVPLSIQPQIDPFFLKAYPNPTTGTVSVDWNVATNQAVSFQIVSLEGKVIQQVKRPSAGGLQSEVFDLGNQPAGLYLLRVTTQENGVLTRILVKQ